ncbi:sensor domain-containing protein [Sulfurirhabdus autotrophica]|uniref:PAS domain S-box-containing protein/diguanylate cyclase (GGDEF)-like protein n=1 Tax=Sulfurirhabdus autotrophica TaxID=1706046 RepID=A0A4R3XWF3_9PROT|nr:PAS domain S-box protein [Sulfurirhabdus autotrophica]TCV83287.1 PAS domain S-box-containing protein/diguanylate cyclase (GGDEF)-like protein [Sulfurirhabdus autotrophica]
MKTQEQATLLSNLIDSAMDAIVSTDESQNIIIFNHAAELMFGRRADEIIGQPLEKLIPARFHASHRQHVENFGRSGITTRTMTAPGVSYALRANGEEFLFEASISQVEIDGKKTFTAILRDISVRKQTEKALKESNTIFRQLTENIREVFWLGAPDWNEVFFISPAYEKIWGRSCESLYSRPLDWLDAVVDADREQIIAAISKKSAGNLSDITFPEYRILRPDGSERWIYARAFPVIDAEGKVYRIAGIAEDITERKQAEMELRHEHDLNQRYLDTMQTMMVALDHDGCITMINRAGCVLLGYKEDELLGRNWFATCLPQHDLDKVLSTFHKLLVGDVNAVEYFENPVLCRDGSERMIAWHNTALCNERGNIIGTLGSGGDITESKLTAEILRISENKFSKTFHSSPNPISITTLSEGRFIEVNDAWVRITGYTREEAVGHTSIELDIWEKAINRASFISELTEKGRVTNLEFHFKTKIKEVTCLVSAELVEIQNKQCIVLIAQDITVLKQTEHALKLANERLSFALSAAGAGSWDWDMRSGKLDWSNELYSLFGMDSERKEATFEAWRGVLHPDDAQAAEDRIMDAIRERIALSNDYRIVLESGEERWIRALGNTTYDEQGNALRMAGICFDISIQKKAEEKLQLSARVFAEAHEGIVITDADANIIDVNPAFCDITGYRREEAIGQNLRIFNSGRQPPEFYTLMMQSLAEAGYWQGEMWNRKNNGVVYAAHLTISALRDKLGNAVNFVGLFSDITQTKQQQQSLELMAHYDALTQLPNRVLFADRFKQAMNHCKRDKSLLGVCYLDLDDFKKVNDTYGHEAGDQLLIEIARRIKSVMREEDTISRQGGDEFALLLGGLDRVEQCFNMLERIHRAIVQPYVIDGQIVTLSASSGITIYPLDEADEPDTLLRHADQAMYLAKLSGRNHYQLFDPEHDLQVQSYRNQLHIIEGVFARKEFCLYYQPKVNMMTGEVVGLEALIRWNHPEHGILPPSDFLPVIEGTSLEIMVGNWVIDEALRQMAEWKESGLEIKVSVNISPRHLQGEDFFMHIESALAQYPEISPQQFELEVLESSAMEDLLLVSRVIRDCHHRLGIKFSLDDFGTGYSSLTHIRNLDVSVVKIDQSFVSDMIGDPDDYAIVEAVLALSKAFRREVIAEGVETKEHGLMLLNMGCTFAQGYGIARPMPPDAIPAWVRFFEIPEEWKASAKLLLTPKETQLQLLRIECTYWLEQLEKKLNSSAESELRWPIMIKEKCHCGRWVEQAREEKDIPQEWLNQLEHSHDELHSVGNELMHLYHSGKINESRSGIGRLRTIYQTVEDILNHSF